MAQTMTFPTFTKYKQHLTGVTPKKIDMYTPSGDPTIKVGLGDVYDAPLSDKLYVVPNEQRITLPSEFELMDDDDLVPVLFGLILWGTDGSYLTLADSVSIFATHPILVSANGGLTDGMYDTGSLGWATCMGGDFTAIARIGIPMTTDGDRGDGFALQIFIPNQSESTQVIKPSPAPMLASKALLQRLYDAFIAE